VGRSLTLLILLIVGGGLLFYWLRHPGTVRSTEILRWSGAGLAVLLLLLLLARGGLAAITPLMVLLVPLLLKHWHSIRNLFNQGHARTENNNSSEGISAVDTCFLHMTLDHSSGEMHGKIVSGRYENSKLDELSLDALLEFWQECQIDAQSVSVLEAWLDRTHGSVWRERLRARERVYEENDNASTMTREEAYEILGLTPDANQEDIKAAHRRLMQRVHPDRGGSAYLAARINCAKDLLLGN